MKNYTEKMWMDKQKECKASVLSINHYVYLEGKSLVYSYLVGSGQQYTVFSSKNKNISEIKRCGKMQSIGSCVYIQLQCCSSMKTWNLFDHQGLPMCLAWPLKHRSYQRIKQFLNSEACRS